MDNDCGCPKTENQCAPDTCTCPVLGMTTDCITVSADLTCSNILKGQTQTEVLKQLDTFICSKFDSISNFMQLVNVGTGTGVYKGINGVGAKELKTLLGSNLITLTNNANEIVITVNEVALNTLIGGIQSVTKTSDLINDGEIGTGKYLESIVKADTNITLILDAGETVGKFHNGETLELKKGWTLEDYVNYIGKKLIPAVFVEPTAQLTANNLPNNTREVGESLSINLTASYTQNDGGGATGYVIKKNGASIATANTAIETIVLTTSNVTYLAEVTHSAGTGTKPNSLGGLDSNTISLGTKASNSLLYRGYRGIFYGSVATKQTTSAGVRSLTKRLENLGNVFTLTTGNTNNIFQLWLPTGISLTSVIDLDALNANITSSYTSESLSVNDAGGTPIVGTLYTFTSTVPYTTSHAHQITIN